MSKKRVKLFDLNDSVQAVAIMSKSEEDNHSIKITFYLEHDEMFVEISLELEYEDLDVRDLKFEEEISPETLIRIFNGSIEKTPLEKELIIKNPQ